MFNQLPNFLLGTKYYSIEHYSLANDNHLAFLLVHRSRGELNILSKETILSNLLTKRLDKKFPCFLILNNVQVVQKEVAHQDSSDEKLLYKAFPHLSLDDFYYEIWRIKGRALVAVARKEYCEQVIDEYLKKGISIAGISLGVCAVNALTKYANCPSLATNNQIVHIDGDQILSVNQSPPPQEFNINSLQIQNSHLLSFAGLLHLAIEPGITAGSIFELNQTIKNRYFQRSFFSKIVTISAASVLTILLLNFFVFSYYFRKAQENSETVAVNKSVIEAVAETSKRIKAKEVKLNNISGRSNTPATRILNSIGQGIPVSIILSKLEYNPLLKKVKPENRILFEDNTINVSGIATDNIAFTEWISNLNRAKWVEKVTIQQFGSTDLQQNEFTIMIQLANETAR